MVYVQTKVETEAVVWFAFKAKEQLPSGLIFNGINPIVNSDTLSLYPQQRSPAFPYPFAYLYDLQQKDLQVSPPLWHAVLELKHRINAVKHQIISKPCALGKAIALSLRFVLPLHTDHLMLFHKHFLCLTLF